MLTLESYKALCSSLYFDIRDECGGASRIKRTDMSALVSRAFGFDSDKAIKQRLRDSPIEISPKVCDVFCALVEEEFGIKYQRSVFTFKWPNEISFTISEIEQFWCEQLKRVDLASGADRYTVITPIIQYKKGYWIVAPESPVSVNVINAVIGEDIAVQDNSHTDIVLKRNESAGAGDVSAMYSIAGCHLVKEENAAAFDILHEILSIDGQHQHALTDMAMLYLQGVEDKVDVDLHKAEQLYRQAASLGSAQAAHVLGFSYDRNGLFDTDFKQAFAYHQLAIERGNHASINCLIAMIMHKRGVPESLDPQYLNNLFKLGLELQDPDTIKRCAEYHELHGTLSPEYVFELRKSCVEIDPTTPDANRQLAYSYGNGIGCEKNIPLAIEHYLKEIELYDCTDSMYELSHLYLIENNDKESWHKLVEQALGNINDTTSNAIHILLSSGLIALENKDFRRAEELFNEALEYSNSTTDTLENCRVRLIARYQLGITHYLHSDKQYGIQLICEAAKAGYEHAECVLEWILEKEKADLS